MRAGDGIWAVGDVTGKGAFTHVAMYQAGIASRHPRRGRPGRPTTAPCPGSPSPTRRSARSGLTEEQAREQRRRRPDRVAAGADARRAAGSTRPATTGFIKLVADADRGVLVGATSAGPVGGEVLRALAVAVHGEVPVDRLRHMIYAYPTFHRAIEDALRELS